MRTEEEIYVETNYRVIYEDDFFLIVDKPSPLPVHPVGRFKEKNLLSFLQRDMAPESIDLPGGQLRIVNRLDSETSGLVIVAKSGEAAGRLGMLFEKRQVEKEYQAVVFGIPSPAMGTISTSLGTAVRHSHRVRVPDPNGQTAVTEYQVLKNFGAYSLIKITPRTGRTHQIRAHMSFVGCPIVGDKIYIDSGIFDRYIQEGWQEDMRPTVKSKRLLLHASKLEFKHPYTGELMKFDSDFAVISKNCGFQF
ncbi:MAG: RluA family pseudouridine synthase [Candidatus Omnitrophica bacterium]|nr:RluA family pseudouridine synthase [Candidatus Omnitrophota bacterium]